MMMTLTLKSISPEMDEALRKRAEAEGKSVDEVATEILHAQLLPFRGPKVRDLSEFAGTWIDDPVVNQALKDQDQIEPDMWR